MSLVKKINVLMVLPDLSVGGVSMVVLDICNLIDEEKYNVHLLLLSNNVEILKIKQLKPNIKIDYIDYEFLSDYSVLGYYKYVFFSRKSKSNIIKFNDKINLINPDIVHFHCNTIELYLGRSMSTKYKDRLLFTDHSVRLNSSEYSPRAIIALTFLYRYLLKPFNIIAVSQVVKDCIDRFKLKGRNRTVFLINNSVNADFFISYPEDKIELRVVYVSRINAHKGHKELIDAWSMIEYKGRKKLIIVGPDELNGSLMEQVSQLKIDESVEFLGPVSNIKEILQTSSIAVFPSHKEGLPIALLEKMSMALPVVVSDIPELTNVIANNKNGLVFKKGDPSDLARKIDTLLFDKELRMKLGNAARESVVECFSKKNEIEEVSRIYELTLNTK
jgi:glycosyltransferase involved in cell wall biosynthesis